jgi:hypothetical protein
MRIVRAVAFAAILFGAEPAAAAMTAHYATSPGGEGRVVVQVNERGDSRISFGSEFALLTIGGVTYVLAADLSGLYAVRRDDVLALTEAASRAMLPPGVGPLPPAGNDPPVRFTDEGTETVSRYRGTLWVYPAGAGGDTRNFRSEFVVSSDPSLAPIGRALAGQFRASENGLEAGIGPLLGKVPASFLAVLQRGTVLRMYHILQLVDVEAQPIPPSVFTLAAPVLSRDQFIARVGWQMPRH